MKKTLTLKVSTDVHDLLKEIKNRAKDQGFKYSLSEDIEKSLLARLKSVEKELNLNKDKVSVFNDGGEQIEFTGI